MRKAVFVTGTICSGKSTLSERLGKELNMDVISETNSNGLFGIVERVKNSEFTPPPIIEHAEIHLLLNYNEISRYFDEMAIILLNVSDDLLTKNLNERKARGATGDYLKIDIFAMKKEIENHFNKVEGDYIKYIANVNTAEDYDVEYQKIIDFLADKFHVV
ncbi:MAG: AAA family ATPase [Defluviitaleaceae bacterium]|nr:AAA family ATPase [Defluviitaleaceae bacterium]